MELRSAISEKFSMSLPATIVFDYPTPSALAKYVAAQLAERQRLVTTKQHVSPAELELATVGSPAQDSGTVAIASVACRYPGKDEAHARMCFASSASRSGAGF